MTRLHGPPNGAPFALLVIHAFAFGAALTRLAEHMVGRFDGGIKIPELVPAHAGPLRVAVLAVLYAVAVVVLYLRPAGAWAYVATLTCVQAAVAALDGTVPLFGAVIVVLLLRPSARRSRTNATTPT